jgi:hypothetical protein
MSNTRLLGDGPRDNDIEMGPPVATRDAFGMPFAALGAGVAPLGFAGGGADTPAAAPAADNGLPDERYMPEMLIEFRKLGFTPNDNELDWSFVRRICFDRWQQKQLGSPVIEISDELLALVLALNLNPVDPTVGSRHSDNGFLSSDSDAGELKIDFGDLSIFYEQERRYKGMLRWISIGYLPERIMLLLLSQQWIKGRSLPFLDLNKASRAAAAAAFVSSFERSLANVDIMFFFGLELFCVAIGRYTFQAWFNGMTDASDRALERMMSATYDQYGDAFKYVGATLLVFAPFIISFFVALKRYFANKNYSKAHLESLISKEYSPNFWKDSVRWWIYMVSPITIFFEIDIILEYIQWHGEIGHELRMRAFDYLHALASMGKGSTRSKAIESLVKIAHGIAFSDLPSLRNQYTEEEKVDFFWNKYSALVALKETFSVSQGEASTRHRSCGTMLSNLGMWFERHRLGIRESFSSVLAFSLFLFTCYALLWYSYTKMFHQVFLFVDSPNTFNASDHTSLREIVEPGEGEADEGVVAVLANAAEGVLEWTQSAVSDSLSSCRDALFSFSRDSGDYQSPRPPM